MAKKKNIHVVSTEDQRWSVKREDSVRASKNTDTKKDAVDAARDLAKKDSVELIIHGLDGKIQRRDSYGNDPFPPKG